ncbi:metallophosphoesterase [Luedemannella helvata]|uniref:metallophosphoesterase n=1 Tax=Luedemannella helvata TaxID=349315 RepID=UPI003CD06D28
MLFALSVVVALHYYLWRKLVRATTRPGTRGRRLGSVAVIGAAVLLLGTFFGTRFLPHSVDRVLAWPGYLWMAVMFYLVVFLIVAEVPTLVARRWLARQARTAPMPAAVAASGGLPATAGSGVATAEPGFTTAEPGSTTEPGPTTESDLVTAEDRAVLESRRLFLARGVAITAGLVAGGVTASGVGTALGPPQLKRVQIPLARLPRAADGLRVALVSDIHLGPLRGIGHTRRIVDMINGLDADIVAIVGDLVDGSVAELGPAAGPLRELRARHGSYFVTGNHEYFSGYEEWITEVSSLGVAPLRNERVQLPNGVYLAGVNDVVGEAYGDAPDFDAAMADRDPTRPVVLLAHQPVQAYEAAKRGADLQLSGHTHGGQIWPFTYIVKATGQPVVSGLGTVDGMPVYVTNGAGFWGPPVRVGAPPDISLVELRSIQ